MSILDDLPEGFDRHRDALAIVEGGACNPNVAVVTMLRCRNNRFSNKHLSLGYAT